MTVLITPVLFSDKVLCNLPSSFAFLGTMMATLQVVGIALCSMYFVRHYVSGSFVLRDFKLHQLFHVISDIYYSVKNKIRRVTRRITCQSKLRDIPRGPICFFSEHYFTFIFPPPTLLSK